ncbi:MULTISPECIES: hypothetical protein [unclassified Bradyrhizobium]|uniref:hypothetical protein n=1 Tax=unclassified Bradyrhizobium TaxID=2631580 RepID=UPI0028E4B0E7|nr:MULTISPECIES: hypothetical protein [unclassified Bradyrhizobium]
MAKPGKVFQRLLAKWRTTDADNVGTALDIDRLRSERDGYRAACENLTQQATQWHLDADGYRAAFESLQAEATEWRQTADGLRAAYQSLTQQATQWHLDADRYRNAFESLQAEATQWRETSDGFCAAYETCCAERSRALDECDRLFRSLEKFLGRATASGPGPDGHQICFLHIGKTAGTSLQHALSDAFKDAVIFHEVLTNFDTVTPLELVIHDLVIGHFTYQHVAKLR